MTSMFYIDLSILDVGGKNASLSLHSISTLFSCSMVVASSNGCGRKKNNMFGALTNKHCKIAKGQYYDLNM